MFWRKTFSVFGGVWLTLVICTGLVEYFLVTRMIMKYTLSCVLVLRSLKEHASKVAQLSRWVLNNNQRSLMGKIPFVSGSGFNLSLTFFLINRSCPRHYCRLSLLNVLLKVVRRKDFQLAYRPWVQQMQSR